MSYLACGCLNKMFIRKVFFNLFGKMKEKDVSLQSQKQKVP
jgi:hypothetical protein